MIRLFLDEPLSTDCPELLLSKEQSHYLLNVMRLKPGDSLAAFNGRDGEFEARLAAAGPKTARLAIGKRLKTYAPGPDLDLIVALVKRDPLERIVEKAVELGVRRIRLVVTRRTNAERTNLERLRKIAVEAAEQSGRLDAPELFEPVRLDRLLDGWEAGRRLIFCDEAGDDPSAEWGGPEGRAAPMLDALKGAPEGAWAILIGPEGGFDPAERARLRDFELVTPVTLGPRILRADTAAVAALSLWQAALGDLRRTKP
jgi:16S rRNA (uracil1498-N3)-methyltransferase